MHLCGCGCEYVGVWGCGCVGVWVWDGRGFKTTTMTRQVRASCQGSKNVTIFTDATKDTRSTQANLNSVVVAYLCSIDR